MNRLINPYPADVQNVWRSKYVPYPATHQKPYTDVVLEIGLRTTERQCTFATEKYEKRIDFVFVLFFSFRFFSVEISRLRIRARLGLSNTIVLISEQIFVESRDYDRFFSFLFH